MFQNKLYLSVDNKKYALDLEGKFTDSSVLLKRDLWRDDKCYTIDLSYQTKMTGKSQNIDLAKFKKFSHFCMYIYSNFVSSSDVMNYEKSILIHIDLEPYVKNGEKFVIEGKTIRSSTNYDHRLSLQWAPEKKVEYNFYSSSGKSGKIFDLCRI